jgi:hypothetical protein
MYGFFLRRDCGQDHGKAKTRIWQSKRWEVERKLPTLQEKKKGSDFHLTPFLILVGRAGFEPATNGLKVL